MKNNVRKLFDITTNFTAPAGVYQIDVYALDRNKIQVGHSCVGHQGAIDSLQNAFAWGNNTNGELGIGNQTPQSSPILVLGGFKWLQLNSNGAGGMAGITTQGDAYCWGYGVTGQLGNGTNGVNNASSSPVLVLGRKVWKEVISAGAAGTSAMALDENGDAYSWGENGSGQGGTNDTTAHSSPVIVTGALKWVAVTCSGSHSGGRQQSTLSGYMWGLNNFGQLGLGNVVAQSAPALVIGGKFWRQMRASGTSTFGIDINNDMYAWGANDSGQLGLGDVTPRSSPVLVLGGLKWQDVAMSRAGSACAGITTAGDLYAWGANANGQLGLGDVTPRSSPVLVLGGLKWTTAWVGSNGLGITSDGKAMSWGNNNNGQLGLGDVVSRSSPILVLGPQIWRALVDTVVAHISVPVVPGTTYSIAVFARMIKFGTANLVDTAGIKQVAIEYVA